MDYLAPDVGGRLNLLPLSLGRGVRRELALPGPPPQGGIPPSKERVGVRGVSLNNRYVPSSQDVR